MPERKPGLPVDITGITLLDGLTRRSSIRRILLVILTVALLPLVALAAWQGLARIDHEADQTARQLQESARLTAASGQNIFASAQGALSVLARNPAVRSGDQALCQAPLLATVASFAAFSNVLVIDADGVIRCSSNPAAIGLDVSHYPAWAGLPGTSFAVSAPQWGSLSQRAVMSAMLPLRSSNGEFEGAISASVDIDWLNRRLGARHKGAEALVALVDGTGQVIASSRPLAWRQLDISGPPGEPLHAIDGEGAVWDYAVAPIHQDSASSASLHIIYARPGQHLFSQEWWFTAGYFALPLLALLLASFAIWVGANRAILRWVKRLGHYAREIGRGEYAQGAHVFTGAPREIRRLASDMQVMGGKIEERDRHLMDALEHQQSLVLELHHRVRNNLQLITSFLSLQGDAMPEDSAGRALAKVRLRVSTLALVHRMLFDRGERSTVSTTDLLGPVCKLVSQQAWVGRQFEVDCDLEDQALRIDTAVPLSLWVVEATELMIDRGAANPPAKIEIRLETRGDRWLVSVSGEGLGQEVPPDPLGMRLVGSIARQLGGNVSYVESGSGAGTMTLDMPATAFAETATRVARPEQSLLETG